ncbi:hypothetical protein EJ04DRAFT_439222 [Polyplosphaeria fusca]|uniref:Tail specific protease domain-containing protein n=1 Tax=Polyplosphaeria fusca TaxID=682080 RepID=A0A9P4QYA2_9PLEO|nr:hypothetical protein EJ04DRAFT_439222 [Polyplosphaeria fusca]
MRSIWALPALLAIAVAQETFSFGEQPTGTRSPESTAGDVEPTATETVSGPISTASACAQISEVVADSDLEFPSVEAELAYACLKSVPISQDDASSTVDAIKQMVEFQSTLTYLKSPPESYFNDGVDILGGLDDIKSKVDNGDYDNEYDFENDVAVLLNKAHDGHLSFEGYAYGGVFRWRRSRQVSLISASSDGSEVPKVWAVQDFNKTGNAGFTPSAVSKIDGKDAVQFLQEESDLNSYHDPDTRYNAMFYMQSAESYGLFTNPRSYPGPTLNLTFENGTDHTYINAAVIMDTTGWSFIESGRDFYDTYISYSTASKLKKREPVHPHKLPRSLRIQKNSDLSEAIVPESYPEPVIMHSASDVPLGGYFLDTAQGTIGVLMIGTFNTETNSDAEEFQAVIQEYIAQAQSRKVEKHIIDVRTNGGGKILLGYDAYLQFFPSQEPQLQSRYRGSDATNLIGSQISSLNFRESGSLFTSPYNYHSYLDKDLKAFSSWEGMYPPEKFNDDIFTTLLRYNLSDPLTTSSDRYSIGIDMTGYGSRSNFTTDPFRAEDLLILSDGICASTCSLFTELMVQQSSVRTLAIGGRPSAGPMQPVGGTKGSLVLQAEYLQSLSQFVVQNFASSTSEAREWARMLPQEFSINAADASVNFQDNIRKGLEAGGMPTQFLNDTATCRVWYEPVDYINVTRLWEKVAGVGFGGEGGALDEGGCVVGSVTSQEQQGGRGEANPSSAAGSPSASHSKGAAVGGYGGGGAPGMMWTVMVAGMAVVLGSVVFGTRVM